ncbi:MAG: hypothetical protein BWY66_02167 [bacterium ADurb.Bin374]|nr:MAG: hypothetical protein BWY66_02167 [bacterium ADurb.Bin374]
MAEPVSPDRVGKEAIEAHIDLLRNGSRTELVISHELVDGSLRFVIGIGDAARLPPLVGDGKIRQGRDTVWRPRGREPGVDHIRSDDVDEVARRVFRTHADRCRRKVRWFSHERRIAVFSNQRVFRQCRLASVQIGLADAGIRAIEIGNLAGRAGQAIIRRDTPVNAFSTLVERGIFRCLHVGHVGRKIAWIDHAGVSFQQMQFDVTKRHLDIFPTDIMHPAAPSSGSVGIGAPNRMVERVIPLPGRNVIISRLSRRGVWDDTARIAGSAENVRKRLAVVGCAVIAAARRTVSGTSGIMIPMNDPVHRLGVYTGRIGPDDHTPRDHAVPVLRGSIDTRKDIQLFLGCGAVPLLGCGNAIGIEILTVGILEVPDLLNGTAREVVQRIGATVRTITDQDITVAVLLIILVQSSSRSRENQHEQAQGENRTKP